MLQTCFKKASKFFRMLQNASRLPENASKCFKMVSPGRSKTIQNYVFECSFRSPRDRPEISNLWRFHAHFWFGLTAGICIFLGFYQFLLKSAFEPITPPLKWVYADAACKVSMIFFNIASIRAGRCTMVPSFWFFLGDFAFRDSMLNP